VTGAVMTRKRVDSGISGVLVIDKPEGWTSHDVVAKTRGLLGTRKVGHTGTLDPLGTGVLPICVGDATKVAGIAQNADKTYRVSMRLGVATDTQDSTGTVAATADLTPGVDWETLVRTALDAKMGPQDQIPPMYAAIKVDGEPLYKKARRGETVERKARRIIIHDIRDVEVALPEVHFTVACTKGTYVRTLAADVGDALGIGAHMTALRRLVCGPTTLEGAVTIAELEAAAQGGTAADLLHGEDYLLSDLPLITVSEYTARRMVQGIAPHVAEWFANAPGGHSAPAACVAPGTLCRVYGESRGFFALVEMGSDPARPARIRRIVKTGTV